MKPLNIKQASFSLVIKAQFKDIEILQFPLCEYSRNCEYQNTCSCLTDFPPYVHVFFKLGIRDECVRYNNYKI